MRHFRIQIDQFYLFKKLCILNIKKFYKIDKRKINKDKYKIIIKKIYKKQKS